MNCLSSSPTPDLRVLILAFISTCDPPGHSWPVELSGVFGLFASSIYWNWYGFPNVFFLAQAVDLIVGWSRCCHRQADSACADLIVQRAKR
jgi:hypothetical protein